MALAVPPPPTFAPPGDRAGEAPPAGALPFWAGATWASLAPGEWATLAALEEVPAFGPLWEELAGPAAPCGGSDERLKEQGNARVEERVGRVVAAGGRWRVAEAAPACCAEVFNEVATRVGHFFFRATNAERPQLWDFLNAADAARVGFTAYLVATPGGLYAIQPGAEYLAAVAAAPLPPLNNLQRQAALLREAVGLRTSAELAAIASTFGVYYGCIHGAPPAGPAELVLDDEVGALLATVEEAAAAAAAVAARSAP